ncbi:hypothetical protein BC332_04665 [Capsicum chinense]|nr:hypothetical protein BC332_04665 [Capsicum chinense]
MVSNSRKGELGSSSLLWGFDEKENESKAAKLKLPAKGSKNFMSMTISTSSNIAQSRKKKILVERNDPVRTSITLSDGKATFYSANSEEHNQNSGKVTEPKETVPVDGLPSVTKTPNRVFDKKENESKEEKQKSPAKGSKNVMSMTISTSSKIAQSRKKKILVERNDPVRTSITLSNGKATFYSANSEEHNQNSGKVTEPKETVPVDGLPPVTKTPKRLGSSSLSWGFDKKENESKAAKLKSPAKGSKNFMSLMISASSKIAQSRKKKILVERNDPVRTSITLFDGKATFFSVNSEEHNQNYEKVMEPKEIVPDDGFPPITKTPKRVTFSESS